VPLLQPGQIFAQRYRVDRLLAEGGMGAVFAAEQLATEMRVALKVLWPRVLSSSAVEKLRIEAKVAARVNSDHIVRVLDAGFDEETRHPYLVMELLEGTALENLVHEHGPCSPESAVVYVGQAAMALDKSHGYVDKEGTSRPIIHRDLKPENLFLTHREDGAPVIKILDFGIAKVLGATASDSQEMKGTPLYMAFEQASGGRVTPQTDVWALGLIAFFLLTGRPYWKTAHNDEAGLNSLFAEILSLPIDPPSQRLRELGEQPAWGPDFDEWFLRCVDREPARRFASAGEAARALSRALLGTELALPGSLPEAWSGDPNSASRDPRAAAPFGSTPASPGSPSSGASDAAAAVDTGAATLPSRTASGLEATGDKIVLVTGSESSAGVPRGGAGRVIAVVGGGLVLVAALAVAGLVTLRDRQSSETAASAAPEVTEVSGTVQLEAGAPEEAPTASSDPSSAPEPAPPPEPVAEKPPRMPAPAADPDRQSFTPAHAARSAEPAVAPPGRSEDDLYGER